jgi:hypothetical protein
MLVTAIAGLLLILGLFLSMLTSAPKRDDTGHTDTVR